MKKHLLFLITAVLLSMASTFAQGEEVFWKKNFGGSHKDVYQSVTAVQDGVVAVGYSESGSFGNGDWTDIAGKGGVDAIVVKYDNAGSVIWKKNFGGENTDYYISVTAVPDGIVAVGYSESGSFDNGDWTDIAGKGGVDAIVVKYDNDGSMVWKKNFGGNNNDYYISVAAVPDGIVAVGMSEFGSFGNGDWVDVTGKGSNDAIIVKYDNAGNVVWKKNFAFFAYTQFSSVAAVSDGIVAVGFCSQASPPSNPDAIIVKYNNDGNVVWEKRFGGVGSDFYESVTAVSDGIIAVGYSNHYSFNTGDWVGISAKGNNELLRDATIVKYSNNGNVVWKKNFGGFDDDLYSSVVAVPDGIVAVGYSRTGSFGNSDWVGVAGKGNFDAVIVKYNDAGNVVLKKNFGGSHDDHYFSITSVIDGIVAVGYSGSGSFGNGDWNGVAEKGNEDAIIVKYTVGGVGIIGSLQESNIKIYPNPTTGELRIENGDLKIENVEVHDVYGRKHMFQTSQTFAEIVINISHLSAGIYFVKISTEAGQVIKKVLKE